MFTQIINGFTLGESVEEDCHCPHVHGVGSYPEEVGGNAGQFATNGPNGLTPGRELPTHQFLDSEGVGHVVGQGSKVVQSVGVGDELVILHVFGDFFITAVQKADIRVSFGDLFAVEFEDEAKHAMGCRVRWPHVQDELFTD